MRPRDGAARPVYHRVLSNTIDGGLVATPAAVGMIAQAVPGPVTGPWALAGMALSIAGLTVKLYFDDRKGARTEKLALTNADNARLNREVAELKARNELVYGKLRDADAPVGRGRTVLLVEDSDGLATMTMKALRGGGFRVRRCKLVADGMAAFDAEPPDMVVCDLKLDDQPGEIMIDHALRSGLHCRVVVLTGSTDEKRIADVRARGVTVLMKPISADVLLDVLRPDPTDADMPTIPDDPRSHS